MKKCVWKRWLVACALTCATAVLGAENDVVKPSIITSGEAPAIDGSLSDSPWAKAPELKVAEPILDSEVDVSGHATTMKLLADDATLFVGVECRFPPGDNIIPGISDGEQRRKQIKPVFENDCFELFLAPDGGRTPGPCYHFAIDLCGYTVERLELKPMTSGWKTAAVLGKDRWTAEMAIPLKSIGSDPSGGHYWHLNACRNIYGVNGEFVQGLALRKPGYHSPSELMILGPVNANVLLKHVEDALRTMDDMKSYLTGPDKALYERLTRMKEKLKSKDNSPIPVKETIAILDAIDINDEEISNSIILNFMFGDNG